MLFPVLGLGFPPCWRAYFFLLRQEKVAKKKATPGYAVGVADCPALLEVGGGCGTRATPSDSPRPYPPASALLGAPHGDPKVKTEPGPNHRHSRAGGSPVPGMDSRLPGNNETDRSARVVSPGPLRGAEQRRSAGGLRRALFEGRSPELRSRPAFRVAQGTGVAGTDLGSPSFCLLFLGEARKSETPRKGGTPAN